VLILLPIPRCNGSATRFSPGPPFSLGSGFRKAVPRTDYQQGNSKVHPNFFIAAQYKLPVAACALRGT